MSACILCCIILKGQHSGPTGRHRLPTPWPQNTTNLHESMLLPSQECQIAHLGTLASPVEPKWQQGLAAATTGAQRPPKYDSNSSQICNQASKKTSIPASKHPSLGSQRSAAEAVAFSISGLFSFCFGCHVLGSH